MYLNLKRFMMVGGCLLAVWSSPLRAGAAVVPMGYIGGNPQAAIAAGWQHSLAVKPDGTLVAFGKESAGQNDVPAGSNYVAVADYADSLALTSDGTLVAWGHNNYGQTNVLSGSNYMAITEGATHSLALTSDGTIEGWGSNLFGETDVPSGSNFVAVAAGRYHSLALTSEGTLVAWGQNNYGQTNAPAGSNYVAIAAGTDYLLALTSEGTLVAWGQNYYGQTDVPAGGNYVAISAGVSHSLALTSDGTLVGWGYNNYGQTDVPAGGNYVAIAAGRYHSLALKSDGSLVAWGSGDLGETTIPSPNSGYGPAYGVDPVSGPIAGGTTVVISGFNLGNGSDITNVTLCGIAATILSQTVDSVTVTTGAGTLGTGDVVVQSTSYGTTSKADIFTYEKNSQTIDFPSIGKKRMQDTVTLRASASSGLDVGFSVVSGPGTITDGTNLSFTAVGQVLVEASQSGNADWSPALSVTNAIDMVLIPGLNLFAGDLIVQACLGVGNDTTDSLNFGDDTVQLKENNLRMHFDDSSTSDSFAKNDWRFVFNDTISGGENYFAVEDASSGSQILCLDAGAPTNSFYMDSAGNIGIGEDSPAQKLHIKDGDTPTIRLEQDTAKGYGAQIWDMGGDADHFFVKDVSHGNTRPFRIIAAAPENTLVLNGNGKVGMGVQDAQATLHINVNSNAVGGLLIGPDTVTPVATLHVQGSAYIGGTLEMASSRSLKENICPISCEEALSALSQLEPVHYNYIGDSESQLGFIAEDVPGILANKGRRSLSPMDFSALLTRVVQNHQQREKELVLAVEKRRQLIQSLSARIENLDRRLQAEE